MSPELFKHRTKKFALDIMRFSESLPANRTGSVIARQLLRSATSVGANYRAACRAKSAADFISKMGTVEEECDESLYWLELLEESGQSKAASVSQLKKEGSEILAMIVSSINTVRSRSRSNPKSATRNSQ